MHTTYITETFGNQPRTKNSSMRALDFRKCSMYRIERSYVSIGDNISRTRHAMPGKEHASNLLIAFFTFVHIGEGQNSSGEYQVHCCRAQQPREKTEVKQRLLNLPEPHSKWIFMRSHDQSLHIVCRRSIEDAKFPYHIRTSTSLETE